MRWADRSYSAGSPKLLVATPGFYIATGQAMWHVLAGCIFSREHEHVFLSICARPLYKKAQAGGHITEGVRLLFITTVKITVVINNSFVGR